MGINECLSDPALPSFDLEQCPSLQRLLDALQLGNKNPAIPPCEMSCLQQFAKVGMAAPAEWVPWASSVRWLPMQGCTFGAMDELRAGLSLTAWWQDNESRVPPPADPALQLSEICVRELRDAFR